MAWHWPHCSQTHITFFPCTLHRREDRENWKAKQETGLEQTNLFDLMPLLHLNTLVNSHSTHKNVFQNQREGVHEVALASPHLLTNLKQQ